ncbi:metalloendoproteinase 1-like [Vicia villosa]|uniref:metalloendoproteinase 1-like n=1 Tax=Vicia villosa TaxID=3911 RepID=UPI00273C7733|nr:metalloendoproteinase 1-like [Vicia villosa]
MTNTMKSHLFELLFFLLLFILNTSTLSAHIPRFSPSVGKQLRNKIKGQPNHYTWKNTLDKFKELPRPDAQPAKEIKGLSEIKQFLYDFGYLQQPGPFNDILDQTTILALKIYQRYFNLQVTGDLNNETLQQISLPRCGVPDKNFKYGFTDTVNVSWPKGNTWFPFGTRNLTYGFLPESKIPLNSTQVMRNALTRWSRTTNVLNFTETAYNVADIKIGFYIYNDEVADVVIGSSVISKQLNSNVTSGVISLEASKYWVLPDDNSTWSWKDGEIDLETAVMHQIGHILGLDHSYDDESIMYPTILPSQQRKVQITDSDNKAIQQLYSNVTKDNNTSSGYVGRFTLFGSSYGFVISLSLGFAFMAMLN